MSSHAFTINCKQEEARFRGMLALDSAERVMAIRAGGESGKTHFLRRLARICLDHDPLVPASLVDFAVSRDANPLELARAIRKGFGQFVDFTRFDRLMTHYDMRVWSPESAQLAGQVIATGMHADGAENVTIGGLVTGDNSHVTVNDRGPIGLVDQQALDAAAAQCRAAFWDELAAHCRDKPAVIILDTYEQGMGAAKGWLEDELHGRCLAGTWPERLLVVMAGKEIPAFSARWPTRHYEQHVIVIDDFGRWKPEDIEEGFRDVGFEEPPSELSDIVMWLERGARPGALVELMLLVTSNRGG